MAIGTDTFNSAAGSVNDLFGAVGDFYKMKGYGLEKQGYESAAALADQNAKYTEMSTAIKETQLSRQIYQSMSGTEADIAGAGLARSGSALNILADSASQGALTKQVLQEQGLITEAGYKQQAESYRLMAEAAGTAGEAAGIAGIGSSITGAIKGAAALAPLLLL